MEANSPGVQGRVAPGGVRGAEPRVASNRLSAGGTLALADHESHACIRDQTSAETVALSHDEIHEGPDAANSESVSKTRGSAQSSELVMWCASLGACPHDAQSQRSENSQLAVRLWLWRPPGAG